MSAVQRKTVSDDSEVLTNLTLKMTSTQIDKICQFHLQQSPQFRMCAKYGAREKVTGEGRTSFFRNSLFCYRLILCASKTNGTPKSMETFGRWLFVLLLKNSQRATISSYYKSFFSSKRKEDTAFTTMIAKYTFISYPALHLPQFFQACLKEQENNILLVGDPTW